MRIKTVKGKCPNCGILGYKADYGEPYELKSKNWFYCDRCKRHFQAEPVAVFEKQETTRRGRKKPWEKEAEEGIASTPTITQAFQKKDRG